MNYPILKFSMKNGRPFTIQSCLDPRKHRSRASVKRQIANGIASMSKTSIYQRFAARFNRLSESMLDHLASMDGKDHIAWAAFIDTLNGEKGIGLARYIKMPEEKNMAEFAVTVIDEFQKQGIGYQLLCKLVDVARNNRVETLRGYILQDNKHMISLCKRFNANIRFDDPYYLKADIKII